MDRAPCSLPRLWVKGTANRVSQIKGKRFNGQARRQLWLTCASVCRMCTGEGAFIIEKVSSKGTYHTLPPSKAQRLKNPRGEAPSNVRNFAP